MNPPVPVVAGSTDAGTGRRVIVAGSAVRLDSGLYADLSDRTGLSAPIVEACAVRPRAWQAGGQPATPPATGLPHRPGRAGRLAHPGPSVELADAGARVRTARTMVRAYNSRRRLCGRKSLRRSRSRQERCDRTRVGALNDETKRDRTRCITAVQRPYFLSVDPLAAPRSESFILGGPYKGGSKPKVKPIQRRKQTDENRSRKIQEGGTTEGGQIV